MFWNLFFSLNVENISLQSINLRIQMYIYYYMYGSDDICHPESLLYFLLLRFFISPQYGFEYKRRWKKQIIYSDDAAKGETGPKTCKNYELFNVR